MARLTIDGKEIEVADGTRLFDACTQVRGKPLPHFCYHPDLSIAGVCRLCQVEIEGMPKLTIACNTIVSDGMVVHTRNDKVSDAVRKILEMHLINHPVDCPICDQAGECGLQDQYMDYGLYESEVAEDDKVTKAKAVVIGPHVILDKERCVLCSRCVRFCAEVTKTGELGVFNRGDRAEIDVAPGKELANNYSLNTVDICPVGALTSRDFRFQKRVWMLSSTPSICVGCATGCNVRVDHAADRIYRLKPRFNTEVNGRWMCDRGRMVYKAVHDEKRLTSPLLRRGGEMQEVTWQEIWPELTGVLKPGQVAQMITGPQQTLEELVLLLLLADRLVGESQVSGGLQEADRGEADDLLVAADRTPNRTALSWLGIVETPAAELAERLAEDRGTVFIYGGDPGAEAAVADVLQQRRRVVYLGTHANATARLASVVIPTSSWAEKDGLLINKTGRVQAIRRAVARPGAARNDWRILAELLSGFDEALELPSLATVRAQVAQRLGLSAEVDLDAVPEGGLQIVRDGESPAGGDD